jgi:LytS/YehU family sensor histidine kinase
MRGYLGDCSLMTIALIVAYLVRSQYREKMADVENESLRAENLTSRYETLKTQMDPHFLFNSLNTLKSLIDLDTTKAEDFVHQLSSVLRYTLKNEEMVTLEKELDCVRSYCKMMKIRYGDNLIFDHHINHEKYDNYHVLPLSIQGLIENAIKHNVISSRQPLTVQIMTDDNNHLIVSNEIHPKIGKEEGSGIGLANLSERYRIKWNENVEIFDDGKNFTVTLPLKQNE